MSADSLFQNVGAQTLPVSDGDVVDTLAPLDKARDGMLALFASALNDELSGGWDKVAALVPSLAGTQPVADTFPGAPSPEYLAQRKFGFPCLFLSRDGQADIDEFTLWEERFVQTWGLHYILNPLDVGNIRKLGDVLVRVATVCMQVVRNMRHLSYMSGAYPMPGWGISMWRIRNVNAGQAKFAGTDNPPTYAAMSMVLETTELTGWNDELFPTFTGFAMSLGTGTSEGLISPIVQADSEVPLVLG